MTKNGDDTKPWVDPDDAPELTDEWFARAERFAGGETVEEVVSRVQAKAKGGPPEAESPKVSTTIRLDADVVAHFKAGGPGWQTRINDTLRHVAGLDR
ncbi:BrnA antitoxin family protein [uncultured Rhodospira sp.]|uniref:BrnA antitoxin family protein n=1 Tax=uncultured Rhodospira sp. TaxID=1936189 RepID=UPI0026273434|nr:BrnA antitoxin family protein [uncultured Rhodospira sp.]